MAVTTKKQFPATTNATTTVFSPVSIQLNNQDDLDVYVTLSGGTRVLQLRQSTGSTAQSSHPQVNNTDGLYFPAVSAGTTLYNYTLSSDNNTITFNSALPSGAVVFCERRTRDADSAYTSFASGSTIRATDLNNSSTESNFTAQDGRNKALDLENAIFNGTQPTVNGVVQPFINSSKIIDGSIATANIADSAITSAKIADGTIVTGDIADGLVTTAKIAADAVTGAKIADDTLNSEHYAAGSIDTEHIADANVTTAKIADSNVTTAKIANANVTTAKIANDAINGTKIADDSIDSEHYVDGSIDTAHIGTSQVTTAKIADANITSAKIATNAVTTDKIADSELSTLAGMQSGTASKLASSTALTADIADLNQIDGMQKATTITDDDTKFPTSGAIVDYVAAQLEPFGGFEAIANESSFPNTQPVSGVCVSIADAGGMVVSSTGTASGATVGGTTVNISGIPTNFRGTTINNGVRFIVVSTGSSQNYTYHKATLKEDDLANLSGDINDFSERYRVGSSNPTTSLDNGDLFFNTGTGKMLVYNGTNSAWEEVQSVGNFFINTLSTFSGTGGNSATPNGTAYKFTLSNAGLNAEQHLVSVDGVIQKPNSGTSQPSEGFAIDGSAIIFGSAPVSGASIFVITIGSTVNIGTPSNNTVSTAILQNGSVTTTKIVDANVTTAKIADDAINGAKIADNAVGLDALADGAVDTAAIVNNAVTADKLAHTSVTAGSYGSATAIPAITVDAQGRITAASTNTVNTTTNLGISFFSDSATISSSTGTNVSITEATGSQAGLMSTTHHNKLDGIATGANVGITDLVSDTSPQLGGDLASNGNDILIADNDEIKVGTGGDLKLFHNAQDSFIRNSTGVLKIQTGTENAITATGNGAVELYHDNSKKFETNTDGVQITTFGNGIRFTATSGHHPQINNADGASGRFMTFFTGGSMRLVLEEGGNLRPASNNSYNLGTSSDRWANIYTNDLNLSNEGSANEMDGTWGDWTIQEGESDLFLKNNRSGKKYKFNLTEVS